MERMVIQIRKRMDRTPGAELLDILKSYNVELGPDPWNEKMDKSGKNKYSKSRRDD